ncbi:WAT1-related protein At5g64700-like [Aristolochia californica]|uniref:WAT1-related protein At5g64700-like n=1 Tax=Aristolochia californica TaxID=171875 RepID=UPI0035DB37F5
MEKMKPYLVAVFIQFTWAGMYLLSKAALNGGLSGFVFTFYRQGIGSLALLPFTIISQRKRTPRLSFRDFWQIFMLAFLGPTFTVNLYGIALGYTSPTLVAATANTAPVLTFLWAVLIRQEVVKVKNLAGKVKLAGVLLCISGILPLILYKGHRLKLLKNHYPAKHEINPMSHNSNKDWIVRTILNMLCYTVFSLWTVLQGIYLKSSELSKLLITALQCIFSCVQAFFIAIAFERKFSKWKLGLDVGLLTIGIVVCGLAFYLHTWCLKKKGPVFISMLNPLSLLLTTLLSAFLQGELIHLGSLLGGFLMVLGPYCVLWSKTKEETEETDKETAFAEEKEMACNG